MLDPENGANPLTIHGGHFLDTLFSLGEFEELAPAPRPVSPR